MRLSDTPQIFFVTFAFLFIGGLFLLIGLVTPQWLVSSDQYIGLWKYCIQSTCVSLRTDSNSIAGGERFPVMQALAVTALLFAAGGGLTVLAFIPMKYTRKPCANMTAIGCLLSSIFNSATVFLFGISYAQNSIITHHVYLGYSFVMSSIASPFLFVASILAFVMACKIRPDDDLPSSLIHENSQATPQGQHNTGIQLDQVQYNPNTVPEQYGYQSAEPYYLY